MQKHTVCFVVGMGCSFIAGAHLASYYSKEEKSVYEGEVSTFHLQNRDFNISLGTVVTDPVYKEPAKYDFVAEETVLKNPYFLIWLWHEKKDFVSCDKKHAAPYL